MAGRPLKFKTVDDLQKAIDAYFQEIKESVYVNADGTHIYEPLTITGLALALDTTRQGLMNYEERDEYYDAIKKAKTRIENYAEKRLFGTTPTGAIFALKNYGWDDKTQQEISGKNGSAIKYENVSDNDKEIINKFIANLKGNDNEL